MNASRKCIAVDIGGSHGRCILGEYDGNRLYMNEAQEFDNILANISGILYWDIVQQFESVKTSISEISYRENAQIDSVGIDTMGVNFALLDRNDKLAGIPLYTRVPQRKEVLSYIFKKIEPLRLFEITGMQTRKLNALFHLAEMQMREEQQLDIAKTFMMLPDLLNYWLSGVKASEYTTAMTSFLMDAKEKNWSRELFDRMGLNYNMMPPVVNTGTVLGKLHPSVSDVHGLQDTMVVESALHDSASAFLCADDVPQSMVICLGTYGILGAKSDVPVINEKLNLYGFANEGAAFQQTRIVHNSPCMSILRGCMETWKKTDNVLNYGKISHEAIAASSMSSWFNPRNSVFSDAGDMVVTLQNYCRRTGQNVPQTRGEIARTITESLAMDFKAATIRLQELTGVEYRRVYLTGGGSKDTFLCQCIADALDKEVVIGPVEASAAGNLLAQLAALGEIEPGLQMSDLIETSFGQKKYYPVNPAYWNERYEQYMERNIYDDY